jgi:hypothetical protein
VTIRQRERLELGAIYGGSALVTAIWLVVLVLAIVWVATPVVRLALGGLR